jgi:predicted transcriptional regulator
LTSRSQKGNSLMNEMSKKVNHLKDELELLRQKINAIDEELKKDSKNN